MHLVNFSDNSSFWLMLDGVEVSIINWTCLYMLIKVPVWYNLVLLIYPSYVPWKSLKSPWIWFWQMGKNPVILLLWGWLSSVVGGLCSVHCGTSRQASRRRHLQVTPVMWWACRLLRNHERLYPAHVMLQPRYGDSDSHLENFEWRYLHSGLSNPLYV